MIDMIDADIFERITQAETLGAAAFLLGALNALEAVQSASKDKREEVPAGPLSCGILRDVDTGRPLGFVCRANDEEEGDEEAETLTDINDALEAAQKNKDFFDVRKKIKERLWEPGVRAGVFDRFAAAVVLHLVTIETFRNILGAVDNWKKQNPGFVAYPFVSNRLRAAYRASGYNYPQVLGALEPPPQKIPFEKTDVGRATARIEAGRR